MSDQDPVIPADIARLQRRIDIAMGRHLDRYGIPSTPEPQVLQFYDPEAAARVTEDGRRIVAEMVAKLDIHSNRDA